MKPKQVTVFESSSGQLFNTLDEWKAAELTGIFEGEPIPASAVDVAAAVKRHGESVAEILAVKPKGRPLNRKDSKPRKVASKTEAT